jgi:glycosyltransferase involved in cell wall biosynthesis
VRVAFLLFGVTGYQDACLRALAGLGDELLLVHPGSMADAPFDAARFGDYAQTMVWDTPPSAQTLLPLVDSFAPDAIMMASWIGKDYRAVMAAQRGRALRILFSSNVWRNTARQWLGRATHRWYIDPLYDCVFVPGDRSEWFARRLGFDAAQVIRGANSADVDVFERGARDAAELAGRRRFLFSGRLVEHKGITVLAEASRRYRESVSDPWELGIVGTGPLAGELSGIPGVQLHSFMQPPDLAKQMHSSSCLILPSYLDYYGVVVHEAATAGLPLLCSDSVGAVPGLLQDGFNGWTVATGDAASLADGMARMSALPESRLAAMSDGSRALARRLSPGIWASNFHEEVARRLPGVRP